MDITDTRNELAVLNAQCGLFHVDIMDGHFVPNITLSAGFIKAIRGLAKLPIEAHLMVDSPMACLEDMAAAGADILTVHAETVQANAFRVLSKIKALGCKAGVCVCPATPLSAIEAYLGEVDTVTVMTVDPGYAGSPFLPQTVGKVAQLEELRMGRGLTFFIQCDGAVGAETYGPLYKAGARAFVVGSSGLFFKEGDLASNCARMKAEFTAATGVSV
jgi:D-allulose-6-phosphate 3-epimerase